MAKDLVIAAGGTGGHLFPAAAFAEAMRNRGWRVTLITDARGRRYAEGFPADAVEDVAAATFQGINPLKAVISALKIWRGLGAARVKLKAISPKIVVGFGGYPSLPALSAARGLKIPVLIHEQNSVLGRVNRYFSGSAAAVASGFERLDKLPAGRPVRHEAVGNPVRPPILAVRDQPFPLAPAGGDLTLLAIGGSQGARLFGEVIPAAIALLEPDLRRRLVVVQQVRQEQVEAVRKVYQEEGVRAEIAPFFTDMAAKLAAAHLVIARAGASTVTELLVTGRPAILVPLAIATDDHQTGNAQALAGVGAADVLPEGQFRPQRLAALLAERLGDPHSLSVRGAAARVAAKPNAAAALANLAEELALP